MSGRAPQVARAPRPRRDGAAAPGPHARVPHPDDERPAHAPRRDRGDEPLDATFGALDAPSRPAPAVRAPAPAPTPPPAPPRPAEARALAAATGEGPIVMDPLTVTGRPTAAQAGAIVMDPVTITTGGSPEARRVLAAHVAPRHGNAAAGRAAGAATPAPGGSPARGSGGEPQDAAFGALDAAPGAATRGAPGGRSTAPGDASADAPPAREGGAPAQARPAARAAGAAGTGGVVPLAGAKDVQALVATTVTSLPHPASPSPAASRAPLDGAAASTEARGQGRMAALQTTPAQIVGRAPVHTAPPKPDPGPIPAQMDVVRSKTGLKLKTAELPPMPTSPRGTVPDPTGPILSDSDLRILRLGELGIAMMARGNDEQGRAEQARLRKVLADLGQATAAAPTFGAGQIGPPVAVRVPVVDEPVFEVEVTPRQRALITKVVGQLVGSTSDEAQKILDVVLENTSYAPGVLKRAFGKRAGVFLLPDIEKAVGAEAQALADSLQLAPDQVQEAVRLRREEVVALKSQAAQATADAASHAAGVAHKVDAATRGAGAGTAATTKRAVAVDTAVAKPVSRVQATVEKALAQLREPIAIELARYDTQFQHRERAIGEAISRQIAAIKLARTRDEIAIMPPPVAGKPRPIHTLEAARRAGEVEQWAIKAIADLQDGPTSVQAKLVATAKSDTAAFKTDLQEAARLAFVALDAWGAEHTKAKNTWWAALDGELQTWAKDANARTELWKSSQAHVSRIALAQDLAAFDRIAELQQLEDKSVVGAYLQTLDAGVGAFVKGLGESAKGGAMDFAGALVASVRERVRAANQADLATKIEADIMALDPAVDPNGKDLFVLLQAVEPGADLEGRAKTIHTAVTRWRGHDEEKIFEAMGGLSPLAGKLLPVVYKHHYDQQLGDALRGEGHVGHLNADEMRTATELVKGDRVNGAVGAINSAISGLGADNDAVNRILRELTPAERATAVARYQERYGVSLDADLRGQWSLSRSEVDESMANANSDLRGADAIAMSRGVQTISSSGEGDGGEPIAVVDQGQMTKRYELVKKEVEAEGSRRNWTTDQINAELALRNAEIEQRFNALNKDAWWAQGKPEGSSTLRTAFELAGTNGRDLLDGMADNDPAKVDVARLRMEDAGVYAEDAAINAIFRDQNARSLAEVQRDLGPIMSARLDRELEKETFATAEERVNRRMQLERENAKELGQTADGRTKERMTKLDTLYQVASGRSLAQMVEANMSGTARAEAAARVEQHGVLTNYQKLRFSIEGLGTDNEMLRTTLAGMTREDIAEANRLWRQEHTAGWPWGAHKESLYEAIENDTSGREQGDMLDMAYNGAPQTAEDIVNAARRRFERDRDDETGLGASLTSSELRIATADVADLESQLKELRKRGGSAEDQRRASALFDVAVTRANTSIEVQRAAVDSITDMIANAAAIVTAVVVGLALSPFTGGGSAVVAAALIGSLAATAVSITVKQMIKGGAYGHEELYTDLAVGAVDALVAVLTAGLGKGLMGQAAKGVTPAAESTLFQALRRMGSIGRTLARGQARVAGTLGKLGTQGVLVRGLEQRALLAGLASSKQQFYKRAIAHVGSELIEQTVQAVPSTFAASMLDERTWRQPGGAMAVFNNTIEGTVHSAVMGLGISHGMNLGFAGARLGFSGLKSVIGHFAPVVPPEIRGLPTHDVLGRMSSPRERIADWRAWSAQHPEGTMGQFNAERQARAIETANVADAQRLHASDAREHLLSGIEPAERGRYADVPIMSVADADFARLTRQAGDAHLLVREGQAVILIREGAPPSAVRPLVPEVRERVFANSGGIAIEAALPERLRDTPMRIDTTLHGDEVRVVATPPGDGPIHGYELVVGPDALPIDVALHAGEIDRVRRWTGRLGEARMALARFGEIAGLQLDSPHDRTRFEAAGEVRKLGPIIEERVRRYVAAGDPHAAAHVAAETMHLLAQQEHAHRILAGEVKAEPRGYVAQESTKKARAKKAAAAPEPMTPEVEHQRSQAIEANKLAGQIAVDQGHIEKHRARIKEAESAIYDAARELHRMLQGDRIATRTQLAAREAFAQRCVVEPGAFDAAAGQLPAGYQVDRMRERVAEKHATANARRANIATIEARLELTMAKLDGLGHEKIFALMNLHLDYDMIRRGPPPCLAPETPVAVPGGSVSIASLQSGDRVLAADPASGAARSARVTRRMDGWTDWLVEIDAGGDTLRMTRSHRLAVDGGGWLPARLVVPGTHVVALRGEERVVERVSLVACETATCNLELAEHHSFYAGTAGILVHNGDLEAGEAPRDFGSVNEYDGEIYYVKELINEQWVVVYVGSTNAEGLTFKRFEGHLREGGTGVRAYKEKWANSKRKYGLTERIDTKTRKLERYGDVMVEVVVQGKFTDVALAINEQAHIFGNQGTLKNAAPAISRDAFEKYYTEARRLNSIDRPCR